MNAAQIKCLLVFSIFAIIGFGPVSPGCLIGMSIVVWRPQWFLNLVSNLYDDNYHFQGILEMKAKQARIKCFLGLVGLFIVDIAPVPVTPVIAFFIIFLRPAWFIRMVANVYGKDLEV